MKPPVKLYNYKTDWNFFEGLLNEKVVLEASFKEKEKVEMGVQKITVQGAIWEEHRL